MFARFFKSTLNLNRNKIICGASAATALTTLFVADFARKKYLATLENNEKIKRLLINNKRNPSVTLADICNFASINRYDLPKITYCVKGVLVNVNEGKYAAGDWDGINDVKNILIELRMKKMIYEIFSRSAEIKAFEISRDYTYIIEAERNEVDTSVIAKLEIYPTDSSMRENISFIHQQGKFTSTTDLNWIALKSLPPACINQLERIDNKIISINPIGSIFVDCDHKNLRLQISIDELLKVKDSNDNTKNNFQLR